MVGDGESISVTLTRFTHAIGCRRNSLKIQVLISQINAGVSTVLTCCVPMTIAPTEVVEVDGPDMTKVLKSNLIWQTLELHLQISVAQAPLAKAEASK